jgi:hypothetical protein
MIKLLDIIEEGTLILTPDERQQIEDMLPVIIDLIKRPIPDGGNVWDAGKISYVYADGEKGEAQVGIGDIIGNARGQFRTYDPQNRTDNWILLNQKEFKRYFPSSYSFQGIDQKISKTLTGDENTGIERLRQVFKHELIHAKDPAANHLPSKQPYASNDDKIYYKSWLEFQTFTGQFFESLIAGTDKVLRDANTAEDIKRIESALSNILQYFAGKTSTITIRTKEFIDGTGSKNIFQKIFSFLNSAINLGNNYSMSEYLFFLNQIKKYNPEGYKEFLKDLYKTIKSIEEKVNSVSNTKIKVQEMKSNINEIKRMQLLAGIITEENNSTDEKAFDNELIAAANAIAGAIGNELKSKDPKQLTEEVVILSAVTAVLTGNAIVGFVSKYAAKLFKLLKWKKGEDLAGKIYHWAHDNEVAFQSPIKRVLGFFIKDPKILETVTKGIYALIVGSMAAGYGAQFLSSLKDAAWFKGALTALKTLAKGDEAIVNAYPAVEYLVN